MNSSHRFERLVGFYPATWRERYGDELATLLEDTYGEARVPPRQRASLLRGALVEHAHASGFSRGAGPAARVRAGALLVLYAWAVFMVTGSAFAKYLEHWDLATPVGARWLPTAAVTAAMCAGVVAVALVVMGALALAVPVARSVRAEGWGTLGHSMRAAAVLVTVALLATGAVILFAHSQTAAERNGGSGIYTAVGGAWGVILLAALATCTCAAVAAAGRVELRNALLRAEGTFALGVFLCMVVVLAGTATWWCAIALYAPRFLESSLGPIGTWGSVVPPVMVGITAAMLVALVAAAAGAWRIIGALRVAG
jgi:hypothetical protein